MEVFNTDWSVSVYDDRELIASIQWKTETSFIQVEYLWVSEDYPRALLCLMSRFRSLHRGSRIRFEVSPESTEMLRLVELLGASEVSRNYSFDLA